MRVFLTYVVPIVLPTALYVLWLLWAGRRAGTGKPQWKEVPWVWLASAGALLAGLVIAAGMLAGDYSVGKTYRPAYVDEQGRVVPGRFE
jgi:ABC-type transport system involved in cytochrome c biogenesis permease subunit